MIFDKFLQAFPADVDGGVPLDVNQLSHFVENDLGVRVPIEVKSFWEKIGGGYFGDRMLYVFGSDNANLPRDSFIAWNKKDFWPDVYPSPKDGGPVFFAETCFGDQLGFRWEGSTCIYVLFCVDTFEAFAVAKSGKEFFDKVLIEKYVLLDEERFDTVLGKLGRLQPGMHYAPFVSPMLGGSGEADNFCFETPNVHFRTAIATYHALPR